MGPVGIQVILDVLPGLVKEKNIDLVIAQAENVSDGKGMTVADYELLKAAGVDFFTGGNWSMHRSELHSLLNDPASPVIRPANYPADVPGLGWKYVEKNGTKSLIVSLLGHIVGRDADKPTHNPLHVIDAILKENEGVERNATIVNFHGDFSSEKRIIGYYLDGRVTAVLGDHWHVPTADAMLLPNGTAHMTDVGMCGSLHSSLGVKLSSTVARWRDGMQTRNELETEGARQFNAALIDTTDTGLASLIEHIQRLN